MDHHENVSYEGLGECSQGSSGGLKRIVSVKPSSHLKLLGMLLVAQQFTIASAEGVCHALDSFGSRKFNLIGLISTFGTSAATKSLSYSALNDAWFYLTGHIGPGSLGVAAMLFDATGFPLAHLLSLGGTGDAYAAARLEAPQGLRYVGLKSYTVCPVINAVGASIVRQHEALWNEEQGCEPCSLMRGLRLPTGNQKGRDESSNMEAAQAGEAGGGRDAKRKVKVRILEVGRSESKRVRLKARKDGAVLLGWVPLLLTGGVIASCCRCEEWFVAGLISWGTIAMTAAVLGLRLFDFMHCEPSIAKGAPQGDCLVVDDRDANTLHIILGREREIQALFQREIDFKACYGDYVLFAAACMLYVYVAASVLYLPNESTRGQILFAIANLIGLVADVAKASKDGSLGLARKAREQFRIELKRCVEFNNRTAAIAFVAKHSTQRGSWKSRNLLPSEGPVWETWWAILARADDFDFETIRNGTPEQAAAAASSSSLDPEDQALLRTLLLDMAHGLQLV